jgi:rhodanese-related sulfurtransferase
MSNMTKQILFIVLASTLLGFIRFAFLDNEEFTLIKQPRVLKEASAKMDQSGGTVFEIPEFMTEPMMASLEFTEYFYRNEAVIIDAREPDEYEMGHIAGAINIPFDYYDEYMDVIDSLDYTGVHIIYCSGGECSLSLDLADILFIEKSFENVFVFEEGFPAWQDAELPVE